MLDHHIQKKILTSLVEHEAARFADLRPANVEANAFTYHLHQLMKLGLIVKSDDDGLYRLTAKGKLEGVNVSLTRADRLLAAHSIILIAVRDDERWLLRRRLVQPMYGRIGFIHGEPEAGRSVVESAADILLRRTGLSADFKVRGSGFITTGSGDDVESYVHFVMVEAGNCQGELIERDSHGENQWLDETDFSSQDMIGSMAELTGRLQSGDGQLFFTEIYLNSHH